MSEEKKAVELKDKELEKVNGGNTPRSGGFIKPCSNFSPRSGVVTAVDITGTPLSMGQGYVEYYDCNECIHYHRPEGPCNLGHN